MQQVAAAAGVSLKTVSRVVNRERGVSPALIARVDAAVERLGYRHNLAASQLRRGRVTSSIGILLQDLGNDFCAELLRAVEDRARDAGLVVMSASLDEDPDRERDLVRGLVERRIDGLPCALRNSAGCTGRARWRRFLPDDLQRLRASARSLFFRGAGAREPPDYCCARSRSRRRRWRSSVSSSTDHSAVATAASRKATIGTLAMPHPRAGYTLEY